MKTCSKCLADKLLSEFDKDRLNKDGHKGYCRKCRRVLYGQNNKSVARKSHLQRTYGLTVDEYDGLLTYQNHACGICGKQDPLGNLSIDHDHQTGQIRGLLCRACNAAIGALNDDPELLRKALRYLEGV